MQADLAVAPPGEPEVEPELDDAFVDEPDLDVDLAAPPAPVITEMQVRDMLDGLGRAGSVPPLNMGVDGLWRFTVDELDGLVPPLTRIINKRPPLARAVARGDEVMVALQLASYLGRRGDLLVEERRRRQEGEPDVERQRQARDDAASDDAGSGPVDWRAAVERANGGGSTPPDD